MSPRAKSFSLACWLIVSLAIFDLCTSLAGLVIAWRPRMIMIENADGPLKDTQDRFYDELEQVQLEYRTPRASLYSLHMAAAVFLLVAALRARRFAHGSAALLRRALLASALATLALAVPLVLMARRNQGVLERFLEEVAKAPGGELAATLGAAGGGSELFMAVSFPLLRLLFFGWILRSMGEPEVRRAFAGGLAPFAAPAP